MLTNKVKNGGEGSDHPGREPAAGRQRVAALAGKDYGASEHGFVAAKSNSSHGTTLALASGGAVFLGFYT